jgi:hypothetical protein
VSMISSYFVDSCKIKLASPDKWGETAVRVEITIPCYIEWKTKVVTDISGADAVSTALILMEDRALSYDDRIEVDGREFSILKIGHAMAFNLQHLEVWVQ